MGARHPGGATSANVFSMVHERVRVTMTEGQKATNQVVYRKIATSSFGRDDQNARTKDSGIGMTLFESAPTVAVPVI